MKAFLKNLLSKIAKIRLKALIALSITVTVALIALATWISLDFVEWYLFVSAETALLVLVAWWVIKSIYVVGPDEMAVKVRFGKPIDFCDSGIRFLPYVPYYNFWYLVVYPKKVYNLPYKEHKVVSMATEYHGAKYGALPIKVDSVVYLGFPREKDTTSHTMKFLETTITTDDKGAKKVEEKVLERVSGPLDKEDGPHPLIEILRSKIPIEEDKLQDWTEEVVVNAVRIALGKISWKEATEDMRKVNQNIAFVFKDPESALHKAGFRDANIRIIIQDIKIPQDIEDALPGVDKARLQKDAAKDVAETEAIEIANAIVGMMATARGKTFAEMQVAIETEEGLKGQFWTFFQKQMERKMAIDGKAFMEFSFPGLKEGGIEQGIFAILAMLRHGGGGDGANQRSSNGGGVTNDSNTAKKRKARPAEDQEDDDDEIGKAARS